MSRHPYFLQNRKGFLITCMLIISCGVSGQGFLHADGKGIVNGADENVVLRGIGTGNWMLQEGYMMKTGDIAGTQHEFREKLVNTIGEALTDSFYMVWLRDHCTRTDIDSLASWGFNSVRVAMHYKWFTLPIEEEPIAGSHTWLDIGFALIDSLLDWCGDNEMYLILDLHGAPGGQGANASISDYDPSKPSLWESQENKDKTVALWKRLAERYRDEPWMGGYDLINETNWTFPEGNNSQLRNLFVRITDSIRTVDQNHMIIIEGNWFANDYSGLTPPWDPNLVYSFHKYWSFNDPGSIDWMLNLRDTYNIPIWLGESGENSNTWFTNLITLCESLNIGWSWWPLKKGGINNPLRVEINDDYLQLIDNWRGTGPFLSPEEAFQAVLTFSDRHSIENCYFQKDVVDAMIRQPHTTETLPFVNRTVQDTLFAPEYDLGRNGFAYFDTDTADYHGDMDGTYIEWNSGHAFRNDGVDLEPCEDAVSNGYNVGWTSDGEWLSYTLVNDSSAAYTMEVRSASAGSGARIHVEVNGLDASGPVDLPATGGWQKWVTSEIEDIILPEGQVRISIVIDRGGSNLNFFRFTTPRPDSLLPFRALSAVTSVLENELQITLNKPVTSTPSFEISDFSLAGGGVEKPIESVSLGGEEGRVLTVISSAPLFYNESLRVTWAGEGILHGEQPLTPFSYLEVQNRLARHFQVPVRIQAEDYYLNRGLELESCSDIGGGLNTGYANVGDYLDYVLYVPQAGDYSLDFRIATERYNAGLQILKKGADRFEILGNMRFDRTGGWQNWTTQSTSLSLGEGKYLIRLMVTGEEHNLNWFEFRQPVSAETQAATGSFLIFPNPASARTIFLLKTAASGQARLNIFDSMGRLVFSEPFQGERMEMDISDWQTGVYLVRMDTGDDMQPGKLIVQPSY